MQENLIHFSPIARLVKEGALQRCRNVGWTRGRITDSTSAVHFFARKLTRAVFVVCYLTLAGCGGTLVPQSAGSGSAQAQTAAINWTNVHQVIDGFGASDAWESFSTEQSAFFFGTGTGNLASRSLGLPFPTTVAPLEVARPSVRVAPIFRTTYKLSLAMVDDLSLRRGHRRPNIKPMTPPLALIMLR